MLLKKAPALVGYDWSYQPQRQMHRKYLLAVNPTQQTVGVRTLDKRKFKEFQKRYYHDLKNYRHRKDALRTAYEEMSETFRSEAFWREYLELS